MDVPETRLIPIDQIANIPEEIGILGNSFNNAQVIGIEGQGEDIAEFTRRLVFNTLIGNTDMHLKNWSVNYKDKLTA